MRSALARLELELAPGERLLWAGQPVRGVRFRRSDAFLIPFSLLWLGFSVFWVFTAARAASTAPEPISILFPLFGTPFVLVGLYLAFGRFYLDAHRRSQIAYGVSDRRIIAVESGKGGRVRSLDHNEIGKAELQEGRGGIGSIRFYPGLQTSAHVREQHRNATLRSFELVTNVREVFALIPTRKAGEEYRQPRN